MNSLKDSAEKSPMHILWINRNANFMGGAENYIYKTVLELKCQDVKSSVLYSITPVTEPKWTSIFSEAYPLVDVHRQIDGLKPDIIYLHQWPGGPVIEDLLNCGVPVIRFIHDAEIFSTREIGLTTFGRKDSMAPGDYKSYFPLVVKVLQLKRLISYKRDLIGIGNENRRQTMRCDGLIAASEYMKNHIVGHGCDEDAILVNPLFVRESKDLKEISRDKNHLLFVGQLIRGKGLDLILRAMSLLESTLKLTICGEGKEKEELMRLSQHLGLTSRVSFKGYVTGDELESFYRQATCLIVPSRVPETFCLAGPEAMVFKTPVIASSLGGMGEWQENGSVINFKENDYHSLKNAIEKLLSDEELQNETGMRGYQLCLQKLQVETHINKLLKFMNELISNKMANV